MRIENDKFIFIRHGKLDLPYKSHAEMPLDVLADLAIEKLNPSIDKVYAKKIVSKLDKEKYFDEIDVIYASSSKRCKEVAKFICNFILNKKNKKIPITISKEIKEIEFDLRKIYLNNKKFNPKNLNSEVLLAMAMGKGSESAAHAQKRVGAFIKRLKKQKNKKTLIISHDFIMRIIELHLKNKNKKITYAQLKKTQRNDYLKGFSVGKLI